MKEVIEALTRVFSKSDLAEILGISRTTFYKLEDLEFGSPIPYSKGVVKLKLLNNYFEKLPVDERSVDSLVNVISKDLEEKGKKVELSQNPIEALSNCLNYSLNPTKTVEKSEKVMWFVVAKFGSPDRRGVILLKTILGIQGKIEIIEFDIPQYESYMLHGGKVFPDKLVLLGGNKVNKITKMLLDFCKNIEEFPEIRGDIRKSSDGKIVIINGQGKKDTMDLLKIFIEEQNKKNKEG